MQPVRGYGHRTDIAGAVTAGGSCRLERRAPASHHARVLEPHPGARHGINGERRRSLRGVDVPQASRDVASHCRGREENDEAGECENGACPVGRQGRARDHQSETGNEQGPSDGVCAVGRLETSPFPHGCIFAHLLRGGVAGDSGGSAPGQATTARMPD